MPLQMLAWVAGVALAQPAADPVDPMIEAELGKGVVLHGNEDFSFQIRGRAQERVTFEKEADLDPTVAFQVRRLRLVLLTKIPAADLQMYVQLGFSPQDMESDLLIPLRDAAVTWSPVRDLNVRVGQMKVPFSRERVVSSSALQFVDRSINNAELTLDRDVGVQLFSNDLFGAGERLSYTIGVFNGDGRNRVADVPGVLAVARIEIRPFGAFDDAYVQADIGRDPQPRLSIGASVARNTNTVRERSTSGGTYEGATFTYDHAEADVMFKAAGFSFLGEGMLRSADRAEVVTDGVTETSRSALGWSAAAGFMLSDHLEPAVRVAEVRPLEGIGTAIELDREVRVGFNVYFQGHDLKLQTDYGYLGGDVHPDGTHEVRSQLQVYF